MFEDIKKNKIKSWFIVLLFLAFIAVIVYYICMALDLGELSIIIAMIFAIVSTWGSYYYSDKIVLKLNNARPATREEDLKLVNILCYRRCSTKCFCNWLESKTCCNMCHNWFIR